MTWEIIIALIGTLGIGSGLWSVIDRMMQYNLNRKSLIYKEKLEAFTLLSENILGTGIQKDKSRNVFDTLAVSARARLLIHNKELDNKIHNFFIELDRIADIAEEAECFQDQNSNNIGNAWVENQELGREILNELKEDLSKVL